MTTYGANNTNSGNYSAILGGSSNTNFGSFSSILGGSGNTIPGGLFQAGVFGKDITAVSSNTLHVGNVWINLLSYSSYAGVTPPSWFPLGTVYIDTLANGTLRIQL